MILGLLLALTVQEGAASAVPAQSAAAIRQSLERDPRSLPRAAGDRWRDWTATTPIPEPWIPTFVEGMQSYRRKEHAAALASFYRILELEPDFPPALYQAGLVLFRLRRYGNCASVIERFVEVVPREIGATQVLGHCYYTLGKLDLAQRHYGLVLAAAPESVEALRGQGLTLYKLGDSDGALALLERVIALRPSHADAMAWMAQIELDLGRSEDALAHARQSKELDPFEARTWFLESRALADLGRDEEAQAARSRFELLSSAEQRVRHFESELLLDPRQPPLWLELLAVHSLTGNRQAVTEIAGELERLAPKDVGVRIAVLDALVAVQDEVGARASALAIERECAGELRAWQRLEVYWRSVKDRVRQVQAAERALRLQGGSQR